MKQLIAYAEISAVICGHLKICIEEFIVSSKEKARFEIIKSVESSNSMLRPGEKMAVGQILRFEEKETQYAS